MRTWHIIMRGSVCRPVAHLFARRLARLDCVHDLSCYDMEALERSFVRSGRTSLDLRFRGSTAGSFVDFIKKSTNDPAVDPRKRRSREVRPERTKLLSSASM